MKTVSFLVAILLCAGLNSCLKDVAVQKYTYYVPEYKLKTEVLADMTSSAPEPIVLPGRIVVKGNYIYINEMGKGIHVIDYSQPSSPKNISYIPIPGNGNLNIQGNYLYADEYTDLITLDISNPLDVKPVGATAKVFQETDYYPYSDSNYIIARWRRVDTVIKNNDPVVRYPYPEYYEYDYAMLAKSGQTPAAAAGQSGSMAQFTVLNDRLYSVSRHYLSIFNIDNPAQPSFVKSDFVIGSSFETIYPFENNLFMGSDNAMYIYDASDKDNPEEVGNFGHVNVCDPVIAEEDRAYVTLRSGASCGGETNELDVLDTKDVTNPVLIKSYPFTNPRGLAKDGDLLLVCDGPAGLKLMNAADVNHITQTSVITGFEPNDVIAVNGIAIVTAADGLYLVDYTKPAAPGAVGKINIVK